MDGSPQLLTDVKFTQLRKGGYDPEEVDNYLERINDAVAKLADKLRAATEQAESAQSQVADARRAQTAAETELARFRGSGVSPAIPADEELAKVLVLAQRAADQAIDEANATATKTVADARAKSVNLLAEAEQERERLLVKAHKKADAAAESRARELQEQVEALAAARSDLEADVEALRTHLDGERERLRERVDSVRSALDDPGGLRLAPTPELHDTPIPEVDLPGLGGADEPTAAMSALETPGGPQAVEGIDGTDAGMPAVADRHEVAPETDQAASDEPEAATSSEAVDPVEPLAVDTPDADAPPAPPPTETGSAQDTVATSRPEPELVPLVAPDQDAGDDTIYLDQADEHPTKQVEAQLFAGDPASENRSFVESESRPSGDLFARDEDSPLGEPDEQADAAMRAFFERDLDDPSIAKTSRFGRRR